MKRVQAQAILGGLAANQDGLVTSAQAMARGIEGVTLRRLRDAGLLEPVGRGVYLISGATTPTHLEIRIAWLRLDPPRPAWERDGRGEKDGVVSHRSACLLHQLGDIPAPNVELTVPGRLTTREPWVTLHRHDGPLSAEEITVVDGLPVTTVDRTILDLLQDGADGGHVGGVIADAERHGLLDRRALAQQVGQFGQRYAMPGASGAQLLSMLTAEAGKHHDNEAALDAVVDAAAVGYRDALRHVLQDTVLAEGENWQAGDSAAARILATIQDAARRALTAELGPVVTELDMPFVKQPARQLTAHIDQASFTAALRERPTEVALPDETIESVAELIHDDDAFAEHTAKFLDDGDF